MLSTMLRSRRAIELKIAIMRTFVKLRQLLTSHEELARKLAALEDRYDAQFKVVLDAIRELMAPLSRDGGRSAFGSAWTEAALTPRRNLCALRANRPGE